MWVENGFGALRRGGRTSDTHNLEYGIAELDPVLETDDMRTSGSRDYLTLASSGDTAEVTRKGALYSGYSVGYSGGDGRIGGMCNFGRGSGYGVNETGGSRIN